MVANFFNRIAERAFGLADTVQPLMPSMYEFGGFDSHTHFQNEALDSGNAESKDNSESLHIKRTPAPFPKNRPTSNRQVSQDLSQRRRHSEEVLDLGPLSEGSDLRREHIRQESGSSGIGDNNADGLSLHSMNNKARPEGFNSGADHKGAPQRRERPSHDDAPQRQPRIIGTSLEINNPRVAKQEGPDLFQDSKRKRTFASPEPQKAIRPEVIVKREDSKPLSKAEHSLSSHQLIPSVGKSADPIQMQSNLTERRFPVPESVKTAPTIKVTIGRIEVKAVMQQPPPKQTIKPQGPKLSLDDYLKQRSKVKR